MAPVIFVRRCNRQRKCLPPVLRHVLDSLRADFSKYPGADANLCQCDFPAMLASGIKQVTRLLAKEGDRVAGNHGYTHGFTSRTIDAAWQIDCQDGNSASVHAPDEIAKRSGDRPVEPRTQQRINDQTSLFRSAIACVDWGDPVCQHVLPGNFCVPRQAVRTARQSDLDQKAGFAQQTGSNESIATIVSGATQYQNLAPGLEQTAGPFKNGLSGGPHQGNSGKTGAYGKVISLCHFGWRQQFVHDNAIPVGAEWTCKKAAARLA